MQELELPAAQLCPVAQVQIFRQCIVRPSAGVEDAGGPPDTGRTVEIHEEARRAARGLLHDEMSVQPDRLQAREQRIVGVQMTPARLYHADSRMGKKWQGARQEIARRN